MTACSWRRRPDDDADDELNPKSLEVVGGARLEPSLAGAKPASRWQLERVGYFVFDTVDSKPGAPVLNRTVTLRDSWQAKAQLPEPTPARKTARANTRPPKKSRVEYRAEARDETLCWPTALPPGPRSTAWARAT